MPADTSPEPGSFVDLVRGIRNKEQWARYDSINIGPGARDEDPAWFDNWDQVSRAQQIILFNDSRDNVNKAYSNTSEREDWAQLIYGMWAEFLAPVSDLRELTNEFDQAFARWWTSEVPRSTFLEVSLQDTDNVLKIPATYAPAGHGPTELRVDGASAPTLNPGNNGSAGAPGPNSWLWPLPLGIPAVKKINVQLTVARRIFQQLRGITNAPGYTQWAVQDPDDPMNTIIIPVPNRFTIRVGFLGPRFTQLRGAYSQGTT